MERQVCSSHNRRVTRPPARICSRSRAEIAISPNIAKTCSVIRVTPAPYIGLRGRWEGNVGTSLPFTSVAYIKSGYIYYLNSSVGSNGQNMVWTRNAHSGGSYSLTFHYTALHIADSNYSGKQNNGMGYSVRANDKTDSASFVRT